MYKFMRKKRGMFLKASVLILTSSSTLLAQQTPIGAEQAVPAHLRDGAEFTTPLSRLISFGELLFDAKFTIQDGAGRPLSKGTGAPISDPSSPLVFPRNFDRLSSPEANACSGCHNAPFSGGGGDRVTEVFVLGQRFDHLTFDHDDSIALRGAVDESGRFVTMDNAFNERKTVSMNGSGYLEMVARQMTADLRAIATQTPPGSAGALTSKGVSFGTLTHRIDGTWDTSKVVGLPAPSVQSTGSNPPSLLILPYAQSGNVVSIRQFTNNATNHHHGMQSEERFGSNLDPDGDGVENELTVADITAISLYQATLPVPGQVVPNAPAIEQAVWNGERTFDQIGCNSCHIDALPLDKKGWIYSEPDPYNPTGNLQVGPTNYPATAPPLGVDLTSNALPQPRLRPGANGVVMVPAYTDLRVHDISATSDPKTDPECEPLDQNQTAGSPAFFAGNCKFITRKLWGFYNQGGAFMHHGKFTTAREAVEAHSGEALSSRQAFDALPSNLRDDLIEFLKSLQILPQGSRSLVVDQNGHPRPWPPATVSAQ